MKQGEGWVGAISSLCPFCVHCKIELSYNDAVQFRSYALEVFFSVWSFCSSVQIAFIFDLNCSYSGMLGFFSCLLCVCKLFKCAWLVPLNVCISVAQNESGGVNMFRLFFSSGFDVFQTKFCVQKTLHNT